MEKIKLVGVNEKNQPVGEDHPRATLTNGEVELIRELHAEGMSYSMLGEKFGVPKSTLSDICTYRRRPVTVTWKKVRVSPA